MITARPPLLCACALLFLAGAANAQVRLAAKPQPTPMAPTISQPALPGAPSANGLSSPFPPSVSDLAVPGTSAAGTTAAGTGTTAGTTTDTQTTAIAGAGAYGTRGSTRSTAMMGAGPLTDLDIARSFINADTNHDGDLTRAEAMRLTIAPLAFEEMDANHDDILTRSEYENAIR